MGEPEQTTMHNYAYHPRVASWVQSMSVAQLDQLDNPSDEALDHSPDDFYKPQHHHHPPLELEPSPLPNDMTTARPRQHSATPSAPNGQARSTTKPSIRSVSSPANSSVAATRATQIPTNRPTVRSLAQKFNKPSSVVSSSPPPARVRPVRPANQFTRSTTETTARSNSVSSSPAQHSRGASYGTYKFNHLKPRQNPQPAPATPPSVRRATRDRASLDGQFSPSKKHVTSPSRESNKSISSSRQPFFGEVIGELDASTLGFGIPSLDPTPRESEPSTSPTANNSSIKLVKDDLHLTPEPLFSFSAQIRHQRSLSDNRASTSAAQNGPLTQQLQATLLGSPRRCSPPSRIPVPSKRSSTASEASVKSNPPYKISGTRIQGAHKRASPTRGYDASGWEGGSPNLSPKKAANVLGLPTLPALSYRDFHGRSQPSKAANSGSSLAAVISAPPQPTSPRLRNSRERQTLQESPGSKPRPADSQPCHDYFDAVNASPAQDGTHPPLEDLDCVSDTVSVNDTGTATSHADESSDPPANDPSQPQLPEAGYTSGITMIHPTLSLHTSSLLPPQAPEPLSSTTDFEGEESPVLGIPGSFFVTPPIVQHTLPMMSHSVPQPETPPLPTAAPEEELLQPHTFRSESRDRTSELPSMDGPADGPSELGMRESIPIMLGSEAEWRNSSPSRDSSRLDFGAHTWNAGSRDASETRTFLEDDDSPIDPFSHRETLRPDDSASNIAFYQRPAHRSPEWTPRIPNLPEAGSLTLDSEAYSVINKVLNLYHESESITPEMAYDSRKQVQSVSPIIAQHKDWGSKEATETYLARLLSDANGLEVEESRDDIVEQALSNHTSSFSLPTLDIHELDVDIPDQNAGGTAIIYPSESRRYSHSSRGSTATTILDDGSRTGSFSESLARESHDIAPPKPPKDRPRAPSRDAYFAADSARASSEFKPLPEIDSTGEGLGLSLPTEQELPFPHQQLPPPRPAYSPPPPPIQVSIEERTRTTVSPPPDTTAYAEPHFSQEEEHKPAPGAPSIASTWDDSDAGQDSMGAITTAVNSVDVTVLAIDTPVQEDAQLDPITQALRRRYRVIEELLKTEHNFCCDMMVAHSVFEKTSTDVLSDRERRTLFSNSKDLEKFSLGLWRSLKKAAKPIINQAPPPDLSEEAAKKAGYLPPDDSIRLVPHDSSKPYDEFEYCTAENDRETDIGAVMLDAAPRMERLFTTYFLNHEDACAFIKKTAEDGKIVGWVAACFTHAKGVTNAWDLDSLLVKPCQRILKYPLILAELVATTTLDHPDYASIKAAFDEFSAIGQSINQAKKRQQTLRAATTEGRKEKNRGLGDRIGKNFVKAFTSKNDKTKQIADAATFFEDKDYNKIAQKFGGHFFQIQIVIRDIDNYLDMASEHFLQMNIIVLSFITMIEVAPSSSPEMESTWRKWAMGNFELQNVALEAHKEAIRNRVLKPILEVWDLWTRPQKLMEQRKKGLIQYAKHGQTVQRGEKVDTKLDEAANSFLTINDTLKDELPLLYERTKAVIRLCTNLFIMLQKDWYKTCSKKILPLLETEPEHTTSVAHDFKAYVDRWRSDFSRMEEQAKALCITNHNLVVEMSKVTSPVPTFYSDDTSSRKSSSRRTESIGSDMSMIEPRSRHSSGYNSQRQHMRSSEGPPRSTPVAPSSLRERMDRGISPGSEDSDSTVMQNRSNGRLPAHYMNMDGAFDEDYTIPSNPNSFLSPTSNPSSSRTSGIFNSALPMSDSPTRPFADDMPSTPGDLEEPEVLFLAASLFEFNIAHDRREGGIPYLVYVPGEIFDVIGMKGELWLARNQDDPSRTVGWIWEKHFARILPEEM